MKVLTRWLSRKRQEENIIKNFNALLNSVSDLIKSYTVLAEKMSSKYSALENFLMEATKESEAKRKDLETKIKKEGEFEESDLDRKY